MLRVKKINEILHDLPKPPMVPEGEIKLSSGDRLILCSGFEERAIGVLKKAVSAGGRLFSVYAVSYLPPVEENRIDEIQALCSSNQILYQQIIYDRENPVATGEKITNFLEESKGSIHIDISGMSRLLIVQLLVALGRRPQGFEKVHIYYTEAREYPPTQADVVKATESNTSEGNVGEAIMFLSSGVFEVSIVPELSSTAMQGQPIRLVVFPSFNQNQLTALRFVVQPSFFTIINGIPPLENDQWRTEAIRKLNGIDNLPYRKETNVSTLNYIETLDCLLQIYEEYGASQKIVLAPTGSKMQAVAAGILRAYLTDVQIAYPTPRMFTRPDEYTLGIRQIYKLSLESFPVVD